MTVDVVPERLHEAMLVMRALPGAGCRPRGFGSSLGHLLPPHGRSSLACDEVPDTTPAAIDRAFEALDWLALLDEDRARERRILVLRASNWTWGRIGAEVGMSHEGCRKAHAAGVRLIVDALGKARRLSGSVG